MYYEDLREYLRALEDRNLVVHVDDEVDPDLELAHVLREVIYRNGPTVIFNKVKGCSCKAVGNLFGSIERINMVCTDDEVRSRIEGFISLTQGRFRGVQEVLKSVQEFGKVGKALPRKVSSGPVHEVEWREIDVRKLPAIRQWPREPSRFFTMAITFVKRGNVVNFGYYRLQVVDERRLIMHWMPWRRSRELGESIGDEIPVAIVLGADPITMLMAAVPIPPPLDKLTLTGIVRGRGLDMVEGKCLDVLYPANAEIVMEAVVKTRELVDEGPFGDHVGVYSPVLKYPIVEIKAIYTRADPIAPVTVTGKPLLEDGYMITFGERIVRSLIRAILPEVVDLHIPPHGLGYVYIVSIRKRYPGHAKRIMFLLWSLVPVLGKIIIVVDHDINVRDINQVMYAVSAHVDPQRDILIIPNYPTEELDPSTPIIGLGSKMGIDATRKLPEEYNGKQYPEDVEPDPEVARRAEEIVYKIFRIYSHSEGR
ncbi:MAG: UbiD family decarboxylase [Crenarchaeota archaeon]|nr:UbiD family decarboxylase [Thermoproteota archaeon]